MKKIRSDSRRSRPKGRRSGAHIHGRGPAGPAGPVDREDESGASRRREPRIFYREVYKLVRRIPRGKVATYGQLAAVLGRPRAVRAVGSALRRLSGPMAGVVPWHRVLNAAGRVSFRDGESPELQRELLRGEGVRFRRGGSVDLARFGWTGPSRARAHLRNHASETRRKTDAPRARRRFGAIEVIDLA
jgi:methylated-DNA-protein-cysteine methyltransferase-like protein